MAILQVFSIRDAAMAAYNRPFFMPTVGSARRVFGDEVVKPNSDMAAHAADYELFHLGSFEEESGSFLLLDLPVSLARASDYLKV